MAPITKRPPSQGSQPVWQEDWSSHRAERKRRESSHESEETHKIPPEIWDELSEVGEAYKQKKNEDAIAYLEDRLSKLTTVEPSEEEEDTIHDQFSSHHREVIKKGAGGYE